MSLPTYYSTGTVSVTNGATTVTGSGTGWGGDVIMAGDLFMAPAQPEIPPQRIASVTDGTHLELAVGWPGTTMSADAYEIRFVGDIVRSTAQTRRLLEQLNILDANGRGLFYRFAAATADADPGDGYLRLNNATIGSATAAYLDNLDANDAAVSTVLDTWDDTGATGGRGQLWVRSIASPEVFHAFNVSGSVVDGTGYRKLTLSYIGGAGTLAADDEVMVSFVPVGPAGAATNGTDGKFSGTELIKTAAYTALAGDVGKTIILNKATADVLSFDAAATLGATWMIFVKNIGAGTWTLDPAGAETINGAATISLLSGQSVVVASNGTLLRTFFAGGIGGALGSTDNALLRADGTGGATVQSSPITVDDSGNMSGVAGLAMAGLLDLSAAGAGQIKFPGTQNSSTDVNTLDDVEEGTFTPGASFGGGTTGIAYTTQTGRYFKIGRWVMFMLNLILSSKGSSTGNALITGLPFAVSVSATPPNFVGWAGMASLGTLGALVSGTTIVPHNQGAAGVTQLTDANFTNASNVYSAGAYMAAS